LPQSALAEALAKNFESHGAEETTSQVQPSGNDGQTEPEQTAATGTATETQGTTEPTGEEAPRQEPEATPTEEVPTEETKTGAETATETEDEPIVVKKRIGALLKKIEDLESRLRWTLLPPNPHGADRSAQTRFPGRTAGWPNH
jgi:hypothetical protein